MVLLPLFNLRFPRLNFPLVGFDLLRLFHNANHFFQTVLDVPYDGYVDVHVLLYGCGIDVDVNYLCKRSKLINLARDPVVEPGSDGNDEIAVCNRHVCRIGAVHAEHSYEVFPRSRIPPKAHERQRYRQTNEIDELGEVFCSIAENYPAAGIHDRPPGIVYQVYCFLYLLRMPFVVRTISPELDFTRDDVFGGRCDHILRKVDENRSRPAARCDVESLPDNPREVVHVFHQIVMFRAGPGNSHDIGLLKSIVPDHQGRNLPGKHHEGNRIHICSCDAGHRVRRTRTGSHEAYTGFARSSRITIRSVNRSLLMPDKVMPD